MGEDAFVTEDLGGQYFGDSGFPGLCDILWQMDGFRVIFAGDGGSGRCFGLVDFTPVPEAFQTQSGRLDAGSKRGVITLLFHALCVNIVNSIHKCERCEGGAL